MRLYLGCDLGTSGLKLTLLDEHGHLVRDLTKNYPLILPAPGYSEQDPAEWLKALKEGINEVLLPEEKKNLRSIAIDGQMHGLVILDEAHKVIRPAILWNDGRSVKEVEYLNSEIGEKVLLERTCNIAFAGFTLPKLLWVKNNEPENYKKIRMVLLPKDYLDYCLTGNFVTEPSDACGTLYYDVAKGQWNKEMIALSGLPESHFPKIMPSSACIGTLSKAFADELGLPQEVKVLAGAGDNAGAALGIGALQPGECNISIGTSGTIFAPADKPFAHPLGAIHGFNAANGKYCALACMLSAASSLLWLQENVFHSKDFVTEQKAIKEESLGNNSVFFLPYLSGERSPWNDPLARGAFVGLSLSTQREDLTQAVLEGVGFALKDSLLELEKAGIKIKQSYLTGGGCKSRLWQRILADILGIDLLISDAAEKGPSFGMALLAAVEDGAFASLEEAKEKAMKVKEVIHPEPKLVELYQKRYEEFRRYYPAIKNR